MEQIAKAAARVVDVLVKLKDALSRRKKATQPGDTRALDKEVDELQADLQRLVDLLTGYFKHHSGVSEAIVSLLGPMDAPEGEKNIDKVINLIKMVGATAEIVSDHERRILALERARVGGVQ